MTLSNLLRQTAARYERAVQSVLTQWKPECGCNRPGSGPNCEACPSLPIFQQRVKTEIQESRQSFDIASVERKK
ncbi:MAG: hypothetical protein WBA57_14265 [Elainellaceae cyanobacterium]